MPLLVTGRRRRGPRCAGAGMSFIGIRVPYPNFRAAQGPLWQIDKLPCPGRESSHLFKRIFRIAGIGVVALVALVAAGVLAASVILQGPRLGHLIESALPANRGKLEIGGVTWSLRALVDILTDAPSPITVDGLRILDPEGTVVLDVPAPGGAREAEDADRRQLLDPRPARRPGVVAVRADEQGAEHRLPRGARAQGAAAAAAGGGARPRTGRAASSRSSTPSSAT